MNKPNNDVLKKISILTGVFLCFVLVLGGISYLSDSLKNDVYIKSAEYVLHNSPLCNEISNLKFTKIKHTDKLKLNFANGVLTAVANERIYYALFLNLAGKYGIYQGLFVYSPEVNGEQEINLFCGLVGNVDIKKDYSYYGISELVVGMQKNKIKNFFTNVQKNLENL